MKEMHELLDFLSQKDDYAIFAGFAAQLLLGIKASPDIDILVRSKDKAEEFKKELG